MRMDDQADVTLRPVQPQPIIMCSQPITRAAPGSRSTPVQYVMPGFPTEFDPVPSESVTRAICPYPLDVPRSSNVTASVSEPPSDEDEEAGYSYVALCDQGSSTEVERSKGDEKAVAQTPADTTPKRTPRQKPDYLVRFDQQREMQLKFAGSQISAILHHLEEQLEATAREAFNAMDEQQEQLENEIQSLKQNVERLEIANAELSDNLEVVTAERDHYRQVVLSPKIRGGARG
ncbi:hypothetical protein TWF696_004597 [Orbilia brochopaga]|uniref:Uncharacterized protein n=1 Tax=Orbilia brochopaga TaxID=3140254 RepID=A0AAV9V7D1_9PEZI